ncbi:MAG: hypothetical protein GY847_17520 [Proteobacteria bacterium]|nr:hypothetical protein [Pseudomonadota bacterium]
MANNSQNDNYSWDAGWKGHELAQMKRLARLTFYKKLKWLEQAHRMVLKMEAAHKKNPNIVSNSVNDGG